ncbi:MAG: alpha/beta fold hydrolase [Bacteroidetes bacterium]|nr:MAG: alpha/beta fold hydrolase [Bacteroidota bacterium]
MKLHYREMGEGQAFVILHGLFGYSDNWQTHARKLSEYYRVILVDQRNHGHSPWSEEFSYDLMAEDLKELFDELELEEVILLGHSMGGKTAMNFAQKYQDQLSKLVVVDMGVKAYPMHHEQIIAGLKAIQLRPGLGRSEAEETLSAYVDSPGVKQFLLKNLYRGQDKELQWRMNIPVLEREMPEILSALDPAQEVYTPTLFIRGEASNYVLDEDWEEIERIFPDASLETIQGAGHWVHAEAPKEFLESVLSFCLR